LPPFLAIPYKLPIKNTTKTGQKQGIFGRFLAGFVEKIQ
jgi:hypothetical protein